MLTDEPIAAAATRLILPSWWVDAYEAATVAATQQHSAMEQSVAAGIAPALSPLEMNALAVVVAGFQAQLLSGRTTLVVSSEEHLRHASTAARSRRFMFEKVMQLLPGLRVLRSHGAGGLRSHRIFAQDVWTGAEAEGGFAIELTPAWLGAELLLGYSDAHLDLVRFAQGETEGSSLLSEMPPLALWRSIWLDLQGVEQAVFMRMERSMQWEFRWLQLEGVFGVPLESLFAGLEEADGDGDPRAALERRLKLTARLGRKLCSHGFLSHAVDGQFLALEDEARTGGLSLVWQVARERLAVDAAFEHRAAVCRYMLRHRHADQAEALFRVLLPEAPGPDAMQAARAAWDAVAAVALDKDELAGLCYRPSQTLLPQALFLELYLRRSFPSPFPLPPVVLSGALAELTDPRSAEDLGQRFARFARAASEAPELMQTLAATPLASLTSAVSKERPDVARYLRELLTPGPSARLEVAAEGPRPVLFGADRNGAVSTNVGVGVGASANVGVGANVGVSPSVSPPSDPSSDSITRKAAVSGALASRMRRIASDELQRMRDSYPDRYRDLKSTYLASLDEVGRRLMLDVQKRMQATMFEEHLRQRLVKFMVENPGAWRSGEARKESSGS